MIRWVHLTAEGRRGWSSQETGPPVHPKNAKREMNHGASVATTSRRAQILWVCRRPVGPGICLRRWGRSGRDNRASGRCSGPRAGLLPPRANTAAAAAAAPAAATNTPAAAAAAAAPTATTAAAAAAPRRWGRDANPDPLASIPIKPGKKMVEWWWPWGGLHRTLGPGRSRQGLQ